jgi:hypothetical protein
MAAVFKGTLIYNIPGSGWSETHWLKGPDLGTAAPQLQAINDAGQAMRNSDVKLDLARIVDASNPRLSILPDTTAWATAGTYVPTSVTADVDLAILFREFEATNNIRSRIFFRGFPSTQFGTAIDRDANLAFTTDFVTLMTAYKNAIIANAQLAKRTAPHAFTLFNVSSVVQSTRAHLRRAGRPFEVRRGRRLIA